jgi:hypothetical protein
VISSRNTISRHELVGEVLRRRAAHYGDSGCGCIILSGEGASGNHGDPHGAEIAGSRGRQLRENDVPSGWSSARARRDVHPSKRRPRVHRAGANRIAIKRRISSAYSAMAARLCRADLLTVEEVDRPRGHVRVARIVK